MTQLLKGKDVVDTLNSELRQQTMDLKRRGVIPCLGIIRAGERPDDIAYERGAMKRAETIGIDVKNYILPETVTQVEMLKLIKTINQDINVHGVLIFRPLPKHIDDESVRNALAPAKDMDGITDGSMAGIYAGTGMGYPPCTPEACMEILRHYNIELTGKRAVVIGRSLVVGKPVAQMLLKKNATVTVCHTKTANMPRVCQEAEILIVAAGKAKAIGAEYFNEKQTIIDVGINMGEDGRLCGDVDFEAAEPIVKAITPVPGGVGTVTTSMLMKHVIEAAIKADTI